MKRFTKFLFLSLFNQKGEVGFMGSQGSTPADPPERDPNKGTDPNIVYPEGFDESLKGNASILKFYDNEKKSFNVANVLKSYANAESMLGKEKLVIPAKDSLPEAWENVFDKLGRPPRDKYEIKNNPVDGTEVDKEFLTKYLDTAHKAGLLPKQAQELVDFYNKETAAIKSMQEEGKKAELAKGIESLKKEWGDNYNKHLEKASDALFMFANDEELKAMKEAGMLDNPVFTKLFSKIAESIKTEDKFKTDVTSSFDLNREDIDKKIQSFYDPAHPYSIKNHPQQRYYQDQMLQLQRKKLKMN